MKCPYCASQTKVTNSRSRATGTQTWRRRECKQCRAIWTTHETIDLSTSHRVSHSTQIRHLEPFSRDVLFMSIFDSLKHRRTALKDATYLTDTVLGMVLLLKTPILAAAQLNELTHTALMRFDPTAAAVYAATHEK